MLLKPYVHNGDVRLEDLVGNKGADTAADLGRLRQQDDVITARRDLLRARRYWYPILLDLQKFMVAISRIEVNHDGSGVTAPDAMVWDHGGLVKIRASSLRLIVGCASLPGSPGYLDCSWCNITSTPITQEDVAAWPYSANILLEFTSLLASLHWPHGGGDLGKYGISFFELLIMIELFWGHRLNCEKVIHPHLRAKRPLIGSWILPGDPRELRLGCQFVCSVFRSLNRLPGRFARFIPCQPVRTMPG